MKKTIIKKNEVVVEAAKCDSHVVAFEFNELESAYAESEANASELRALAYESDFRAHTVNQLVNAVDVDSAQRKRNLTASTSTTSKFCRLLESTRQNYRIDKALEQFHTMRELISLTDCSEARIRSHMQYIDKHVKLAKKEVHDNKFRYTLLEL